MQKQARVGRWGGGREEEEWICREGGGGEIVRKWEKKERLVRAGGGNGYSFLLLFAFTEHSDGDGAPTHHHMLLRSARHTWLGMKESFLNWMDTR
jgi:hypothetical protein